VEGEEGRGLFEKGDLFHRVVVLPPPPPGGGPMSKPEDSISFFTPFSRYLYFLIISLYFMNNEIYRGAGELSVPPSLRPPSMRLRKTLLVLVVNPLKLFSFVASANYVHPLVYCPLMTLNCYKLPPCLVSQRQDFLYNLAYHISFSRSQERVFCCTL